MTVAHDDDGGGNVGGCDLGVVKDIHSELKERVLRISM